MNNVEKNKVNPIILYLMLLKEKNINDTHIYVMLLMWKIVSQ